MERNAERDRIVRGLRVRREILAAEVRRAALARQSRREADLRADLRDVTVELLAWEAGR